MLSNNEFAIDNNLKFVSMKNFMLSCVEHERSFLTSGPGGHLFDLCWFPQIIFCAHSLPSTDLRKDFWFLAKECAHVSINCLDD